MLHCFFQVPAKRLVTNDLFWYFIGYLDPKLMRLADPCFLIPSKEFHEHASPRLHGSAWQFTFMASMEPLAKDRWKQYRVNTLELGERVLEIMGQLRKQHKRTGNLSLALPLSDPDLLWLRKAA